MFNIFRKNKVPKIIIQHGRLIDPIFQFYCQNNPDLNQKWKEWIPPSKEEVDKKIALFKAEWSKYNIVSDISKTLNLSFHRNAIDVFVVSGIPRATSHPIILRSSFSPQEFTVTLAHELVHRILSINHIPRVLFDKSASDTTNNHVVVFAVLEKILNNEQWETAVKLARIHKTSEYIDAVNLSKKIGFKTVKNTLMSKSR